MTIAASGPTFIQIPGNGSATNFAFPMKVFAASDVIVGFVVNGLYAQQTSGFSVQSIDNNGGGTVVFTVAPPLGTTVDIRTVTPLTQGTEFANLGAFLPESHTEALDRITRATQDLHRLTYDFGIHGVDVESTPWPALPPPSQRLGMVLVFDPITGVPTVGAANTQLITTSLLAPFLNLSATAIEIAAGVSIVNIAYLPGDARRYGLSASLADNSVPINAAIQVSNLGGPAAYIPAGNWVCTNSIQVLGNASLYGDGWNSILTMVGCDGLVCQPQTTFLGGRFIRDFLVTGSGTGTNNGFLVNFTAASTQKIVGVQIQNIAIQNFGVGFNQRGCWYCTFTGCFSFNNFIGFQLVGQSIVTTFVGCFAHRGTITGTGLSKGWYLDTVSGESPQSNHLIGCNTYNFDRNISIEFAFNTYVIEGDHSQARIIGIYILTTIGNTVIRDNWIETWNAATVATTGILCDNVIANDYPIIIEGNQIWCDLTNLGAVGVNNGAGHRATRVKNNRIENFTTAINNASDNFVSWDNVIKACGAAYNSAVNYVPNNVVNSGGLNYLCTAPNTNIAPPNAAFWTLTINTLIAHNLNSLNANVKVGDTVNAGLPVVSTALTSPGFSYYDQGTFPVTLTGMNGGGTIAGNVSFRANGGSVDLTVSNSAGILGTSAAAAMTLLGLPAYLWPVTDQVCTAQVVDNGVTSLGQALISAATGIITFKKDVAGNPFTGSGQKGLNGGTMHYAYS